MSRDIELESIRSENFQLKNEITDLKNGFDLNRDVLKILQEHSRETHPQLHIFYQIITRLTSINNQVMISNMELLQEKNRLNTQVYLIQCRTCSLRPSCIPSMPGFSS